MAINAASIIRQAMSLVGVLGGAETPSGADAAAVLDTLNQMIDSWNTERLSIFTVQDRVRTGFTGATCTIGPGAMIDTDRPVALEPTCFVRFNGVDYPFRLIDGETWSGITLKTITASFPTAGYWDAQSPVGTLYLWPQPVSAVDLHIRLRQQLAQFADLATDYDFPPGYQRAIVYSLAEEASILFARPLDQNISRIASMSRRNIKRINSPAHVMYMPAALAGKGGRFNLYSGRNE